MADLRREPITRMWVVVTTDDPKGPSDYLPFKPPYQPQETREVCPFCPGHEAMTPKETFMVSREGGGWAVRVIPNKFPFFHIEGEIIIPSCMPKSSPVTRMSIFPRAASNILFSYSI